MKYIYLILLSFVFACSTSEKTDDKTITVSIEPLKYFVDRIGGGDFNTNTLVPKGASAETYEPTPKSIKNVSKSIAFVSIGLLDSEINIINYLKSKPNIQNLELFRNCELLEAEHDCSAHGHHDHEHSHKETTGVDPHLWISVENSKIIAKSVCDMLVSINKDSVDKYTQNYRDVINSLNKVDSVFKAKTDKINTIIVYHPFLGYLAHEYGFTQTAIEDEGKEPSAKKIKELIVTAKDNDIKTIFYQSQFPTNSVKSISDELGAKTVKIDPLEYNHIKNLEVIAKSLSNE